MLVWIFQTGEPLHCDNDNFRPMRAMNLTNSLIQKGHNVKIISSRFYHQKKSHRSFPSPIHSNELLNINLIDSPGYQNHIGFKRLYDHYRLSKNLKVFLKKQNERPDLIFIGYPPINAAYELSKWATKNKIPYLTDVKDKWPDNFLKAIPKKIKFLGEIVLYPLFYEQFFVLKNSKGIISNSEGFLNWCLAKIKRDKNSYDLVAPLSSPKINLTEDNNSKKITHKQNDLLNICFTGTLANSFDFEPIIKTAKKLKENNISARFIIAGDGPKFNELKGKIKDLERYVNLKGWLNKDGVDQLYKVSDLAIAPYVDDENFKTNIPNKIIDYLSNGLPILLPNVGEMATLIKKNKAGFIVESDLEIFEIIQTKINNKKTLKSYKKNAKELYEKKFNFKKVYEALVSHIEDSCKDNIELEKS